jgi:hypothetical protein
MFLFRLWSIAISLALAECAGGLAAQEPKPHLIGATAGFEGKFKAGFWQPLQIHLVAGQEGVKGELEIVASDGDQVPVAFRNPDRSTLYLAPHQQHRQFLYFKSGPLGSSLTARLVNETGVVWSERIALQSPALPSTSELIVSLGPPLGLEEAIAAIRTRSHTVMQTVNLRDAAALPDQWRGYDGVDLLVLNTSDADFLAALAGDRLAAISQWVRLGGRLFVCSGAQGQQVFASESGLASLLPGELAEVEPLRDRTGLENFTKTELPFDDPTFQRNRPLVTRLKNVRGEVLVEEISSTTGRPLVIRAPAGLGQVTFVALDLDHPALQKWKGRTRLLAPLLPRTSVSRDQGELEAHRGVTHLGYEDLVGQLRSALDHFPGVTAVTFTTVSMLIAGYLLLIAPGDFFLLSRLGLPRHLTWLTFPLVALAALAAAAIVQRQSHGSRPRLNQAEIIDIDLTQQIARGTVWSHVFNSKTARTSAALRLAPPPGVKPETIDATLDWQGLPGDALGGLESQQPMLVNREPYRVLSPAPKPTLDDLIIQAASAKSLAAVWSADVTLPKQKKLVLDRYGLLAGEFTHPLDVPLSECLLAHGEKLYRLGSLAPGQGVQMADLPPLNLEARLTQRRVEQTKDVATPWERDSIDIPRIVQMLMFHEAARGRSYTGLTHRYQPQIDLSEHIRLGQAVLVGRAETPVAELTNPKTNSPLVDPTSATTHTWYRIIFPVAPRQLTTDN